jgi:hypothetical protein
MNMAQSWSSGHGLCSRKKEFCICPLAADRLDGLLRGSLSTTIVSCCNWQGHLHLPKPRPPCNVINIGLVTSLSEIVYARRAPLISTNSTMAKKWSSPSASRSSALIPKAGTCNRLGPKPAVQPSVVIWGRLLSLAQCGNFGRPLSASDKPKRVLMHVKLCAVSADDRFHTTSSLAG